MDFEENIKLVYEVYHKHFKHYYYLKEDLLQEGCIGLLKACRTFNNNSGEFSTYAYRCIKNEMLMFMRHQNYLKFENSTDFESGFENYIDLKSENLDGFLLSKTSYPDVAEMLAQGYTQTDIAKLKGVSRQRMNKIVGKLREELSV